MPKLVARHSLSEANNRCNYGSLLFGHPDAPLMEEGKLIAREMGREFEQIFGIMPNATTVAVSLMERSKETALEAGFTSLVKYETLNEVDTKLPHPELKVTIANRQHTDIALQAAQLILKSPPKEHVWITHGLVIAALCAELGISNKFEHFVPQFCEIRELPI
jgi:broad specificity phosphatase PhoE